MKLLLLLAQRALVCSCLRVTEDASGGLRGTCGEHTNRYNRRAQHPLRNPVSRLRFAQAGENHHMQLPLPYNLEAVVFIRIPVALIDSKPSSCYTETVEKI